MERIGTWLYLLHVPLCEMATERGGGAQGTGCSNGSVMRRANWYLCAQPQVDGCGVKIQERRPFLCPPLYTESKAWLSSLGIRCQ